LSFSFGAALGPAPSKHTFKPDYGWIDHKDRFNISTTAEAVVKGFQGWGFDLKNYLSWDFYRTD
jgi:hypothetical protein